MQHKLERAKSPQLKLISIKANMITKNARIFRNSKNFADNCDEIESMFMMKREKESNSINMGYASCAKY